MMADQEKLKIPELTPEQKAVMEDGKKSVSEFNHMTFFYLFNQLQLIENGEINLHLIVKGHRISTVNFNSSFARDINDGKKD